MNFDSGESGHTCPVWSSVVRNSRRWRRGTRSPGRSRHWSTAPWSLASSDPGGPRGLAGPSGGNGPWSFHTWRYLRRKCLKVHNTSQYLSIGTFYFRCWRPTSCADFLLVDWPHVDGQRRGWFWWIFDSSPEGDGVVSRKKTAVILLSESSAIESTGIVAKPLTVGGGPTEENVVIRYDCHVLLQCCVAAIWQKLGALVLDVVSRDTQAGSVIKKKNIWILILGYPGV